MFDTEIDGAISLLIQEWSIAERRIKKAEFVSGNQIVASAIFELRYAGRKLADAMQLIIAGNWQHDPNEKQRILAFLADATEDCVKAKHDAIDAMMLFISKWFENIERTLGVAGVQQFFPEFITITGNIRAIENKITESRGDRIVSRDSIYNHIEDDEYDEILSLYDRMSSSKDRVAASVRAEHRRRNFHLWGTILAIALAAAALTYEVWKDHPGQSAPPATLHRVP